MGPRGERVDDGEEGEDEGVQRPGGLDSVAEEEGALVLGGQGVALREGALGREDVV